MYCVYLRCNRCVELLDDRSMLISSMRSHYCNGSHQRFAVRVMSKAPKGGAPKKDPTPAAAAKHEDPAATVSVAAYSGQLTYPSSMRLDAVRNQDFIASIQEEKRLCAEFEEARAAQRKAADAKDANLLRYQPLADKFMSEINAEIDKLQAERAKVFEVLDGLKITQNEFGQIRDEVKLLDFEIEPLQKDIVLLQRAVADRLKAKEGVEKQVAAAPPASVPTSLQERLQGEVKKYTTEKAKLDAVIALRKEKEDRRNNLRDRLAKAGEVSQQFNEAKRKLQNVNTMLDEAFDKKRQQKPQNKELDALSRDLIAARTRRDDIAKRLDTIRAQLPSFRCTFDQAYRQDLVGKQGATLAQLQEDFGVAINIDTAGDGAAILLGDKEDVDACIEAMKSIVANAERSRQQLVVAFPASLAKTIIGTKGANVERMERLSGASIKIRRAGVQKSATLDGEGAAQEPDAEGGDESSQIIITGTPEALTSAKAMIDEIISLNHVADIPFPPALLDIVIGKGGAMVRKVEVESGAKTVRIHRDTNTIHIAGNHEAVEKAKSMYTTLLADMTQNTFTMRADDKTLRTVIGPSGKTVRGIQDSTGAIVNCGKDVITIRGSKDAVAAARRLIEDIARREEIKVAFPAVLYNFLTTASVAASSKDEEESDASAAKKPPALKTPVDAIKAVTGCEFATVWSRESVVVLRGRRDAVNQARSMLEDLIRTKRPSSVTIQIPEVIASYLTRRNHSDELETMLKREIPGIVGFDVRRAAASIEVAAETKDAADAAAGKVTEYVKQKVDACVRKVEIPAGRSGAVIGSGGKVVADIQQRTGAEIAVKKDSNIVCVFHPSGDLELLQAAVKAVEDAAAASLPALGSK